MRKHLLAALAVTAGLSAGCDLEEVGRANRYTEDFHYSFGLKPGGRLILETFNGSVEIYGWEREEAEIRGTKHAPTVELLESIRIDAVPRGDLIEVRATAPRDLRGNRGAKFVVRVPYRTRLERVQSSNGGVRVEDIVGEARLRTSNGGIRLLRYEGDVEGRTSNGPITLDEYSGSAALVSSNGQIMARGIRGYVEAETSNGSVEVTAEELEGTRPVKLSTSNGHVRLSVVSRRLTEVSATTSNGSITVRLPEGTNAKLKARTSNASISSDFPLGEVTEKTKTRLEGNIGSGGPILDLATSNGGIRVERN